MKARSHNPWYGWDNPPVDLERLRSITERLKQIRVTLYVSKHSYENTPIFVFYNKLNDRILADQQISSLDDLEALLNSRELFNQSLRKVNLIELEALIAAELLGWQEVQMSDAGAYGYPSPGELADVPRYARESTVNRELIQHLTSKGVGKALCGNDLCFRLVYRWGDRKPEAFASFDWLYQGVHDSIEVAACLAALQIKQVYVEVESEQT